MTVKEMIKTEIEKLPENLLAEVFDFIQFLEIKKEKTFLQKPHKNCQPPHLKRFGTIKRMLSMTVYKVAQGRFPHLFHSVQLLFHLLCQKHLEQRLIRNIFLIGQRFKIIKKRFRQPDRDYLCRRFQIRKCYSGSL